MSKKIHAASCIAGSALRSLAVGCALGASLTCVVAAGPQDQLAQSSSSSSSSSSSPATGAAQGQGQPHRDAAPHDTRDLRENRDNRDDARSRHLGHMTPGERRDLRRQINEAGQDIYANSPHH